MQIYKDKSVDVVAQSILKAQWDERYKGIILGDGISYITDTHRLLVIQALPLVTIPAAMAEEKVLRIIPREDELFPACNLPDSLRHFPKTSSGKLYLSFDRASYDEEKQDSGEGYLCPVWLGCHKDRWNFDAAYVPFGWTLRLNRSKTRPSVFELGVLARLAVMPVSV